MKTRQQQLQCMLGEGHINLIVRGSDTESDRNFKLSNKTFRAMEVNHNKHT